MADQILRRDKAQTTDRTGKAIPLQLAGQPTTSTYDDEWILPDDLLAAEQADIAQNESDITALDVRVTTVENSTNKILLKNQNTSTTQTQNADSVLREVYFRTVSGTPTVAIGTTLGGDDIVSSRTISGGFRSSDIAEFQDIGSQTLYITISGGIVDIALFTKESLFN